MKKLNYFKYILKNVKNKLLRKLKKKYATKIGQFKGPVFLTFWIFDLSLSTKSLNSKQMERQTQIELACRS